MTLNLTLPTSHLGRDTLALIDLVNDLRGCRRGLDDILNRMPPLQQMRPMATDADGVSRGLVWGDDLGIYVVRFDGKTGLGATVQPHARTNMLAQKWSGKIPIRLLRQFGMRLSMIEGVAA